MGLMSDLHPSISRTVKPSPTGTTLFRPGCEMGLPWEWSVAASFSRNLCKTHNWGVTSRLGVGGHKRRKGSKAGGEDFGEHLD